MSWAKGIKLRSLLSARHDEAGSRRLPFVFILTGDAGLQVMQVVSRALCMSCGLKEGALVATKHVQLSAAAHNAKEGGRTA